MSIFAKLPHGALTVTGACWEYLTEEGNYAGTVARNGDVSTGHDVPQHFAQVADWVRYLHAQEQASPINRLKEIAETAEGLADELLNQDVDSTDVLNALYDAQVAIACLHAAAMKRIHATRKRLRVTGKEML